MKKQVAKKKAMSLIPGSGFPPFNKKKPVSLKPNSARLKKWVAALERGRYTKIEEALTTGEANECCALGVGMRIYERETKTKLSEKSWDGARLPKIVKDWFGLNSSDPKVCVELGGLKDCSSTISELNDRGLWDSQEQERTEMSFKDIAKGIRKTFGIK